jgi:hypothetical protein
VTTPANLDENVMVQFNGSVLAPYLGPKISLVFMVSSLLALAAFKARIRSQHLTGASLSVLAFFPLVWPTHWVGLYPGLFVERSEDDAVVLGTALLLMANPVTTWAGPALWRTAAALAIALLSWWWVRTSVRAPAQTAER